MEAYKRWVRTNKDYVHSLESLANGMTWLLPERFSSSEIGPEAVTAILGVVTAINEHIIETTPNHMHRGPVGPNPFPYPLCISALKDLETLVEVAAEQYYGDTKKWNFIAASEAIKVLVRLALFRNSGYRMTLHGGEELNIVKESERASTPPLRGSCNQHGPNLEGRAVTALSKFGENARMMAVEPPWLRRVQHQNSTMNSPTLVVEKPTLSSILSQRGFRGVLFLLGETLFITRPLIYVLLIRKYGTRSWTPWFLSLVVDFLGVGIFSPASFSGLGIKHKQFLPSDLEKDEMKRRKLLWALYLMRDPFFTKYTRRRFETIETVLEPVPLIGILAAKVVELIVGAQTRYTYMSGS